MRAWLSYALIAAIWAACVGVSIAYDIHVAGISSR